MIRLTGEEWHGIIALPEKSGKMNPRALHAACPCMTVTGIPLAKGYVVTSWFEYETDRFMLVLQSKKDQSTSRISG